MKQLILILLMIPMVLGSSTLEVSKDNVTWKTANTVVENQTVSVVGLDCDTLYYFRINETGGEYNYSLQKTEDCGLSEMEIAILLFLGVLIVMGGLATIFTSSYSRFVFMLLTGLVIVITFNVSANFAEDAGVSTDIVNVLWTTYTVVLWLYVFLFFSVLVIFLLYLRVRNTRPPDMGSPLTDSPYMRR